MLTSAYKLNEWDNGEQTNQINSFIFNSDAASRPCS